MAKLFPTKDIVTFISQTPLMQGLAKDNLFSLIHGADQKRFKARTTILPAGRPVGGLGLLLRGRANMSLVDATSGRGWKGEKCCNLQTAVNRFISPPPMTLFTPLQALENVNCTNCSSFDYLLGTCTPVCINGELCTMPEGAVAGTVKCPDGVVLEPCRLCNETPGVFECTYTYSNGSTETKEYASSVVTSDLYMDVMGGLEGSDKCCVQSDAEYNYTYTKQTFSTVRSVPIVFPQSGNTEVDCGSKALTSIGEITSYCGVDVVPTADYEITCEFNPD